MPDQDIIIADSVNLYDSNLIREANIDVAPQQAKAPSRSFSSLNETTNEVTEAITSLL